jgi:hypothetical protein
MKISHKINYKMMVNLTKCLFVVMLVFSVVAPVYVVHATEILCPDGVTKVQNPSDCPKSTSTGSITVKNPIPNPLSDKIDSIPKLIAAILHIVLIVGVPIVALAIIYSGFLFVKAQGKPKELDEAKKAIAYTLIGAALLLGSWVIANAIGKTVDIIGSEQPK